MQPKARIVNLTPHDVFYWDSEGDTIHYPPSSMPARVRFERSDLAIVGGVQMIRFTAKTTINLPPRRRNTYLIVSREVQMTNPNRTDLIAPTRLVRENGRVIACQGFSVIGEIEEEE